MNPWRIRNWLPRLPGKPAAGRFGFLSLALLVGGLVACGSSETSNRLERSKNGAEPKGEADVVLITIDTLRADVLGFMGGSPEVSPALDRLAARGRVFEFAHAHSVVTLPSHASILTGRLPYEHGVRANSGFSLPVGVPTLAESLRAAGFATAAFVSAFPLDRRFGLDRGFEIYDDEYGRAEGVRTFLYAERSAVRTVARARKWWEQNASHRRFLWLHLFDPHYPYEASEPFLSRFAEQPYLGEVAAVDAALAPFLDSLARSDRPVALALTADHGEALGDHGEETHGLFAYEATLWVPLVLVGPDVVTGREDRPASHVDLMPTLLHEVGLELPSGDKPYPGRSLLSPAPDELAAHYFEALTTHLSNGWAPLRGVLRGREKYIDLPLPELYDLSSDPEEVVNLVDTSRARLRELRRDLPRETAWPPTAGETTIEDQAMLRGLGYLAGRTASKAEYGAGDDPKNLLELDRRLQRMVAFYAAGDGPGAARLAREVIALRPETPVAQSMLVQVALDAGRAEEAVVLMRSLRKRGLATDALERQLALTLVELGRPAEALAVVEPLVSAAGESPVPEDLLTYGLALSTLGQHEAAQAQFERGLEIEPSAVRILEASALVAFRQQHFGEAASRARQALDIDGSLAGSWNILGVARYSADEPGALEAWQRCVELDPHHFDALFNLGVVAAEKKRSEIARTALERFLAEAPASRYAADFEVARRLLGELPGP